MKKVFLFICCALISVTSVARSYEEVKGDPMKTRIYTLDNGLKVYLSQQRASAYHSTYRREYRFKE